MELHIVTSHWKEDLRWLQQSPYPIILIDKEGAQSSPFIPQHIIPNKGHESSVYLKYIFENYDNLPDHVAFIHGHEKSHHQHFSVPLLKVIASANINHHDFIPLNNAYSLFIFNSSRTNFEQHWATLNLPNNLKPPYETLGLAPQGAQFILSKNLIKKYSKDFYENLYNILMNEWDNYSNHTNHIGFFFEYIWHILWGYDKWFNTTPSTPFFNFQSSMMIYNHFNLNNLEIFKKIILTKFSPPLRGRQKIVNNTTLVNKIQHILDKSRLDKNKEETIIRAILQIKARQLNEVAIARLFIKPHFNKITK
jgi:hypothetical protein